MAGTDAAGRSVTLHSSWRGVLSGVIGSVALLALAVLGMIRDVSPVGAVVGLLGVVLLAVTILDYPIATRFDESGVQRRMILRHHRIAWEEISQFTRTRPGWILGRRRPIDGVPDDAGSGRNCGGLVAVVGRRRYLLVDQAESTQEFAALLDVMSASASKHGDVTLAPPSGTNPTYLYRRRRWGLHGHSGR